MTDHIPIASCDLAAVAPDDYGVHVNHMGNLLDVLILSPTHVERFTLSCPDALDLRDAITEWAHLMGAA